MKLTTNIVLTGNQGRTQSYMIQMTPNQPVVNNFTFKRYNGVDHYAVLYPESFGGQLVKDGNDWYREQITGSAYQLHTANVRIYFPQYSIDTFDRGITYILSLSTYIHGVEVKLGDFEIKRRDALACTPVRFAGMDEYYEYMDFSIVDPYTLLFEDETEPIRVSLGSGGDINEDSSLLYVCLYAVEESDEGYILRNDWGSGQNSLMLNTADLKLKLSYVYDNRSLKLDLLHRNINEYFKLSYNCDSMSILFQYVIKDKENIYYEQSEVSDEIVDYFEFYVENSEFFKSRDNWQQGLSILASATFFKNEDGESIDFETDSFMSIFSNELPLTQELFSKMIVTEGYDEVPSKIDLTLIDMNNINIKAVNKIVQNVTVVTPTDSTKSHLIQPVFYQTRELNKIIIHPSVTENIAINLDNYKPQVSRFKLQVEGIVFNEIGRTSKGIIFKVYGNMLPKSTDEGTMYILDQDNNLVTTGKYSYIY